MEVTFWGSLGLSLKQWDNERSLKSTGSRCLKLHACILLPDKQCLIKLRYTSTLGRKPYLPWLAKKNKQAAIILPLPPASQATLCSANPGLNHIHRVSQGDAWDHSWGQVVSFGPPSVSGDRFFGVKRPSTNPMVVFFQKANGLGVCRVLGGFDPYTKIGI